MQDLLVSNSTRNAITLTAKSIGVVIMYGRGHDLGNFQVFAEHLQKDLLPSYSNRIKIVNIQEKKSFFNFFKNFNESYLVHELHIFAHSIGGGIFLDYGGSASSDSRLKAYNKAARLRRNVTYEEVRDAEIGAILSDDFLNPTFRTMQTQIKSKFTSDAFIKLWGCNSGYENWVYSDNDWNGDGIAEIYWSVLNSKNTPKPSVAQSFAKFFNLKVYGARSGSHVEVFDNGLWITSQEYKNKYGKWANPSLVKHRLHPDKGIYYEYNP